MTENILQALEPGNIAILISNKLDFELKLIRSYKERKFIQIKQTINKKDLISLSIYKPRSGEPSFITSVLLDIKRKITKPNSLIIIN